MGIYHPMYRSLCFLCMDAQSIGFFLCPHWPPLSSLDIHTQNALPISLIFILGLALGLSPIGAWVGIQGTLTATPFLLAFAVVLWTAGFDIIYACQDLEHDVKSGLYSIPKKLGIRGALILSAVLHLFMVGVLLAVSHYTGLGIVYTIGVSIVAALLLYEHSLVKPKDLSRINTAFFYCEWNYQRWPDGNNLNRYLCEVSLNMESQISEEQLKPERHLAKVCGERGSHE